MSSRARLCHRMPGRARVRVAERRGDTAWFERADKELAGAPGVLSLSLNPDTGSILIQHAGELDPVLRHAREHELFDCDPGEPDADRAEPGTREILERLVARAAAVEPRLVRALTGRDDPQALAALVLAGLGLLQVARGQVLPAAVTLFYDAAKILGLDQPLHPRKPDRGPDPSGDA